MIKFAVIGTGAAGLGVVTALLKQENDFEVTVFDIFEVEDSPSSNGIYQGEVFNFYQKIYQEIKQNTSFKFPPPKTHFAKSIPKYFLGDKPGLFQSNSLGGLTNFWGGTALAFTDNEFHNWKIKRKDIEPYYKEISEIIGISSKNDKLDDYFGNNFATRPPFQLTKMFAKLDKTVNSFESEGNYKVVSGTNRVTIETRENKQNTCVYCGECLAGCFNDSIYSTKKTIEKYFEDKRVKIVKGKVVKVSEGTITILIDKKLENFKGFSKIFLCAGCPNSTEIVLRSTGLQKAEEMQDNAVYVFPILFLGKISHKVINEPYLALCNLIFGFIPKDKNLKFAQAQIYPNFDYMWRYNIPETVWRMFSPLVSYSRSRIFWGRLYVHGNESQSYSCELKNDKIKFNVSKDSSNKNIAELMKSVRSVVNRDGFFIPPIKPVLQKTNSHYSSTFPYGGKILEMPDNAEFIKNVYLCDSSVFPELPAVSLTFTIMANAFRIAQESLN